MPAVRKMPPLVSWFSKSIRGRLIVWGLGLLGAGLFLNTVAGSFYTQNQIKQATRSLQMEMGKLTARRIHASIKGKIDRLQDVGMAMSLYPLGDEEQRVLGLLLLKNDPSFTELSILNDRGQELIKLSERRLNVPSDLGDQGQTDKFLTASRGEIYIGPVRAKESAQPYVTLAIPLKDGPENTVGVLAAEASLKFLRELIVESRFGYAGYAYLIDEAGNLIAHQDPSLVLSGSNLRDLPKVAQFLRDLGQDSHAGKEGLGLKGESVISTLVPIADLGWAVILEEPLREALADVRKMERFAFGLLVLGLVLGGTIIAWASKEITQPISELKKGARIIGSGNLDHRAKISTGDEIEELAEEFNKMAGALQSSYMTLEEKVQQRTRELSALYEVTSTVNQSLDLNVVLQAVIKKITQIFDFDATRVFLFNAQKDELELRASFEVNPELWSQVRKFQRGQGIIGRVGESGKAMIFEDIANDPRYHALSQSKATEKARLSFFAVFPIKTQSRIFGTILFNGKAARKLSADEVRLLTSMAEHLGVALEKTTLFEEVKTRSQHLAVLNTIGSAVGQSLDLDLILREAVEKVSETLAFDAAWIYLADPSDGELWIKAYTGLAHETAQAMSRRKPGVGITGWVMEKGERLVFEDMQSDPRYQQLSFDRRTRATGFCMLGSFPVKAKERIVGVLHVAKMAKHRFTLEELQLIRLIAQAIGVAVHNATLFTEVKDKTSELAKKNQDLAEAGRAKSEFMAAMSHELRTPLNVIIGNADLVREGIFGPINSEQARAVQKISRYSRMLLKLINDVLALSRLEAKKMSVELSTVDIEEIISHVQTYVEEINRDKRLEVGWNVDRNLPMITTDATKLEEILQNLIGNAFKFTPEGRIDVRVRCLQEQARVEFSIADTGIGIEEESLEKIFDEFEQIREAHTENYSGVGLGLSIVKKYLDLMHGEIHVQSEPGRGSTFTFSLPCSISTSVAAPLDLATV